MNKEEIKAKIYDQLVIIERAKLEIQQLNQALKQTEIEKKPKK